MSPCLNDMLYSSLIITCVVAAAMGKSLCLFFVCFFLSSNYFCDEKSAKPTVLNRSACTDSGFFFHIAVLVRVC